MESLAKRQLSSGAEYDALIPRCTGEDHSIKKSAGVEDTLSLIRSTVPKTLWHTEKLSRMLKGKTLYETCRNIWVFVYRHVQYRKDKEGVEQVRSPRRTWRDRFSGVDCDCYTEFISSILTNLHIPHKGRIAMYDPSRGWQHIYPVVPKDGKLDYALTNRQDYIVIDCVKDAFDDEQPFLEFKDYAMQLEYLDGLPDGNKPPITIKICSANHVDANDLMQADESDLGELGNWLKKTAQKVKQGANKAIHAVNRAANPATILLRNGFLVAMKINLMNVAGRLRYAYLNDAQAQALNMNMDTLQKLRHVKDRAETIYWQAGGEKVNLKKAILNGKGNKDKKVPMNGFEGFGFIGDEDEKAILYNTIQGLGALGEPATAAALAAASGAVASLAAIIKQLGNLFKPGSKEDNAFKSDSPDAKEDGSSTTDNNSNASAVHANNYNAPSEQSSQDNSASTQYSGENAPSRSSSKSTPNKNTNAQEDTGNNNWDAGGQVPDSDNGNDDTDAVDTQKSQSQNRAMVPATSPTSHAVAVRDPKAVAQVNPAQNNPPANGQKGLVTKASDWVKANPVPAVLIGLATAGGLYYAMSGSHHQHESLHGTAVKRRKKGKKHKGSPAKSAKTKTYKLKQQRLR